MMRPIDLPCFRQSFVKGSSVLSVDARPPICSPGCLLRYSIIFLVPVSCYLLLRLHLNTLLIVFNRSTC